METTTNLRDERRRVKGLPVYLHCEKCDGTGLVWKCDEGCTSNGLPGYMVNRVGRFCCHTVNCTNPGCFDGDLACVVCATLGREPRVEIYGANYVVRHLATQMDGDEPVCEEDNTLAKEESVAR